MPPSGHLPAWPTPHYRRGVISGVPTRIRWYFVNIKGTFYCSYSQRLVAHTHIISKPTPCIYQSPDLTSTPKSMCVYCSAKNQNAEVLQHRKPLTSTACWLQSSWRLLFKEAPSSACASDRAPDLTPTFLSRTVRSVSVSSTLVGRRSVFTDEGSVVGSLG